MTEQETKDQAIEENEPTDREHIINNLPTDIADSLTKRAFSPGRIRKLLQDTYYMGPIGIGRGGWIGVYGNGQAGTQMRRPGGALYNFPRSWRYSLLDRGLQTGIITHVGNGKFAITERGVSLLNRIDVCPDCDKQREPYVSKSTYIGNPNTEGHVTSTRLVTECPECGSDGYSSGSISQSYSAYDRADEAIDRAVDAIQGHPSARTFGGEREVADDAWKQTPIVDQDEIEAVLENYVENFTSRSPRETFGAATQAELYDRDVIPVYPDSSDDYLLYEGTDDAVLVKTTSDRAEMHVYEIDDDERVAIGMNREVAVDEAGKDAAKKGMYELKEPEWNNRRSRWEINRQAVTYFLDQATSPDYFGDRAFSVSVDWEVVQRMEVPVLGIDQDGHIIDPE